MGGGLETVRSSNLGGRERKGKREGEERERRAVREKGRRGKERKGRREEKEEKLGLVTREEG